jgi:hypothetical protein
MEGPFLPNRSMEAGTSILRARTSKRAEDDRDGEHDRERENEGEDDLYGT